MNPNYSSSHGFGRGGFNSIPSQAPSQAQSRPFPNRSPDDIFMLPPDLDPKVLFGEKRKHMKKISQDTGVTCYYNSDSCKIDFWGPRAQIDLAIKAWNARLAAVHQPQETSGPSRLSKGWARPEKPKSQKALKKEKKKKEKQSRLNRLSRIPEVAHRHQGHFLFPKNVDIEKCYGYHLEKLNDLRLKYNVYIWLDSKAMSIVVCGNEYHNIQNAVTRLRNTYTYNVIDIPSPFHFTTYIKERHIKFRNLVSGGIDGIVRNILDQPDQNIDVKFEDPHPHFQLPFGVTLARLIKPMKPSKDDYDTQHQFNQNSEAEVSRINKIRNDNLNSLMFGIRYGLLNSLTFQGLLRLRIRIGTVCLTEFPRSRQSKFDQLRCDYFSGRNLGCAFARSLNITEGEFCRMVKEMDSKAMSFMDNPRKSYSLQCDTRQIEPKNDISIKFEFKPDGRLGLWNGYTDRKEVSTINWSIADSPYDFQVVLEANKLMDHEHPQLKKFMRNVRINTDKKIAYVNTENITLKRLAEKTRWLFEYETFKVEITKANIWCFDAPTSSFNSRNLEHTVNRAPNRTSYTASLYHEPWANALSENLNLPIGESASWNPRTLINLDAANAFVEVTRKFIRLLQGGINGS